MCIGSSRYPDPDWKWHYFRVKMKVFLCLEALDLVNFGKSKVSLVGTCLVLLRVTAPIIISLTQTGNGTLCAIFASQWRFFVPALIKFWKININRQRAGKKEQNDRLENPEFVSCVGKFLDSLKHPNGYWDTCRKLWDSVCHRKTIVVDLSAAVGYLSLQLQALGLKLSPLRQTTPLPRCNINLA